MAKKHVSYEADLEQQRHLYVIFKDETQILWTKTLKTQQYGEQVDSLGWKFATQYLAGY